jgi:hypothetical protein
MKKSPYLEDTGYRNYYCHAVLMALNETVGGIQWFPNRSASHCRNWLTATAKSQRIIWY